MLTPSYLLQATEPAEEIAEKLHIDILNRIVERILIRFQNQEDYILTALDKWQIETLQQAGFLLEDIQKEIAAATPYMQSEIAEAMEDAGVKALAYDDQIYRDMGLDPVPLVQSPYMIQLMQDTFERTAGEWVNFTNISKRAVHSLFVSACDTAYMQAMSGAISPAQAYLEALETVVKGGVYVQYPGGRRDTIETATARAVRTGISQASGRIQLARMDEFGIDLVIVSSHLGARPEHYVWQGKIYSRSGGREYPDFVESTGYGTVTGLCGANCRHNFSPYFEGMKNPFQEYDSEENQKQYELEQRQRTLERRIRETKRETMGWKTAMDSEDDPLKKAQLEEKYRQKAALLQKQNKAYNDFCEETGQKKRSERIQIAKWDRKQAAQARAAAKKVQKSVENSEESGTIKERAMPNGLRKSYFINLSNEDKNFILEEIDAIGADRTVFRFRDGEATGYSDKRDIIYVSSSVFPSNDGSNHPTDLLSVRATLAHEYYGHRAHRGTKLPMGAWNDEFRASYSAARDCPGLSAEERAMLMADAMQRAKDAGVDIKMNSFMRRLLYGYE